MTQIAETPDAEDFRLADFKLLLPVDEDVRALVVGTSRRAFAQHLTGDVAQLDQLPSAARPGADDYDLIFADDLGAAAWLRPGGWLCLLRSARSERAALGAAPETASETASKTAQGVAPGTVRGPAEPGLRPSGRWRAYPDWPAFRVLIPETAQGWRAAARSLRLFAWRSSLGITTSLWPGLAKHWLPANGIALFQRPGPARPTLLMRILETFSDQGLRALSEVPMERWLLVSGRLGPGNPILAFALDAQGQPQHLIKVARVRGATHLEQEAQQLAAISDALAPATSAKVIRPLASAQVDGRWALAYAYAPTRAFFGPRWQLQGRRGFCLAMADWLAALVEETRRPDDGVFETEQLAPLRRLIMRQILPSDLQRRAERALESLESRALGGIPLVLEHGDLGVYNVRLSRADGCDFRVLDWGSSTFDGIPVGDLGYLLCSARAPIGLARRSLLRYLNQTGLCAEHASACWHAYLARRWEELDSIRPPQTDDPDSGGGLLRPIAEQMATYLDSLEGH
jgi:hypothetical protein